MNVQMTGYKQGYQWFVDNISQKHLTTSPYVVCEASIGLLELNLSLCTRVRVASQ